jgi:hypothetical protein
MDPFPGADSTIKTLNILFKYKAFLENERIFFFKSMYVYLCLYVYAYVVAYQRHNAR